MQFFACTGDAIFKKIVASPAHGKNRTCNRQWKCDATTEKIAEKSRKSWILGDKIAWWQNQLFCCTCDAIKGYLANEARLYYQPSLAWSLLQHFVTRICHARRRDNFLKSRITCASKKSHVSPWLNQLEDKMYSLKFRAPIDNRYTLKYSERITLVK